MKAILLANFVLVFSFFQIEPVLRAESNSDTTNEIDSKIIARWKAHGATVCWAGWGLDGFKFFLVSNESHSSCFPMFSLQKEALDKDLIDLPEPTFPFGLALNNTKVTDEGLRHLLRFKTLTALALPDCKLNSDTFQRLGEQKGLSYIIATSRSFTKAEIIGLSGLTNLRALNLSYSNLDDKDLVTLSRLPNLQALSIRNTDVSESGLYSLSRYNTIRYLDLASVRASELGLTLAFQRLKDLQGIGLMNTKITPKLLESLKMCRDLRGLDLSHTKLNDECIDLIAKYDNLVELNLESAEVYSDKALASLIKSHNYQYLNLAHTTLGELSLRALGCSPNLSILNLSHTKTNDRILYHLSGLTQLRSLNLNYTEVSTRSLDDLTRIRGLKYLSLVGAKIRGLDHKMMSSFASLELLNIYDIAMSEEEAELLMKANPKCRVIRDKYDFVACP